MKNINLVILDGSEEFAGQLKSCLELNEQLSICGVSGNGNVGVENFERAARHLGRAFRTLSEIFFQNLGRHMQYGALGVVAVAHGGTFENAAGVADRHD